MSLAGLLASEITATYSKHWPVIAVDDRCRTRWERRAEYCVVHCPVVMSVVQRRRRRLTVQVLATRWVPVVAATAEKPADRMQLNRPVQPSLMQPMFHRHCCYYSPIIFVDLDAEEKIFYNSEIDTTFRPFSGDSSGILGIPITLIKTLQ